MSDEDDDKDKRTESATPRKREEARERGQVPMSTELIASILLAAWLGALTLYGGTLATTLGALVSRSLSELASYGTRELSVAESTVIMARAGWPAAQAALMLIVPMFAIGLLIAYGQIGFQITPQAIGFDVSKLDPRKGFERIFSLRSGMRALFSLVKLVVIAVALFAVAWSQIGGIANLAGLELGPALAATGHVALRCVGSAVLALLVLAVGDVAFQRWQHERDLRMSKQELREEARSTEGDPHVKAQIRRVQRDLARRRMLHDVPKATVIVTNPTHYAVALRYQQSENGVTEGAPRVLAKGVDLIALRIKKVGTDAGVPLFENVPLARALHARCEIGDEIPTELYTAVAEVLAYVYRIQTERETALQRA